MALSEERRKRLEHRIKNIEETLEFYITAEREILSGAQQYSLGSRSLTRANLSAVQAQIPELENLLDRLKSELNGAGRNLQIGVVPLDI